MDTKVRRLKKCASCASDPSHCSWMLNKKGDGFWICDVCEHTLAGDAFFNPRKYLDGNTLRMIAYLANGIQRYQDFFGKKISQDSREIKKNIALLSERFEIIENSLAKLAKDHDKTSGDVTLVFEKLNVIEKLLLKQAKSNEVVKKKKK